MQSEEVERVELMREATAGASCLSWLCCHPQVVGKVFKPPLSGKAR